MEYALIIYLFVDLPNTLPQSQHPTALSFISTPADSKTVCLDMNSFRNPTWG